MNERRIGLIGVGLLGTAIAQRLSDGGFQLRAYDVDSERQADAHHLAEFVDSNDAVFSTCKTVILCLPNSKIARGVLLSSKTLQAESIIIDTTTGDPDDSMELGGTMHERGLEYLDATIAGSSEQMKSGEVVAMVGGTDQGYSRAIPVFDVIAPNRFHLGPCGSGAKMKLVVNLAIGLNRAVLAEALSLAQVFELDLENALRVLQSTVAYSAVMDTKGKKMINREFQPQARLAQHSKDVDLMLAAAEKANHELPLSGLHQELLRQLIEQGHGELDNSAIFNAFQKRE